MKIQIQVLLHLVIISLLFGCKKYDLDGTLINFQRPEKRLIGDWESVAINEVGVIADTNITELLGSNNLRLDISFNEDYSVQIDNVGDALSYTGDWEFNDDKTELIETEDGSSTSTSWTITKLMHRELWLKRTDAANLEYVFHYELIE